MYRRTGSRGVPAPSRHAGSETWSIKTFSCTSGTIVLRSLSTTFNPHHTERFKLLRSLRTTIIPCTSRHYGGEGFKGTLWHYDVERFKDDPQLRLSPAHHGTMLLRGLRTLLNLHHTEGFELPRRLQTRRYGQTLLMTFCVIFHRCFFTGRFPWSHFLVTKVRY